MGVDTKHEDYTKWAPIWTRCREAAEGGDAIRGSDTVTTYVPTLGGENDADYQKRLARGLWYDATSRTLDVWLGALFHKPGTLNVPDAIKAKCENNFDLAGTSYDAFKQKCALEILMVGRVGVEQDYSQQQARPYSVMYTAEQIINWRERTLQDGSVIVDQIVIEQSVNVPAADGYGTESETQWRVLELDEAGLYQVRIVTKDETGAESEETIIPTIQGTRLTYIPFDIVGPFGRGLKPQKPPILSVVDVNIDHFRLDVDYKEALHVNAIATLFVSGDDLGVDDEGEQIAGKNYALGAHVSHNLPQGGTAAFVSGAAQAQPVKDEKEADESRMALLGARMLSRPKRAVETAEALTIQVSGESASLLRIADSLSELFTKLWRWGIERSGAKPSDKDGDTLSRDFASTKLTDAEVAQMLALVVAAKMSTQTFLENMYEGEWMRHDAAEEMKRLEEEAAMQDTSGGVEVDALRATLSELQSAMQSSDMEAANAAMQQMASLLAENPNDPANPANSAMMANAA